MLEFDVLNIKCLVVGVLQNNNPLELARGVTDINSLMFKSEIESRTITNK